MACTAFVGDSFPYEIPLFNEVIKSAAVFSIENAERSVCSLPPFIFLKTQQFSRGTQVTVDEDLLEFIGKALDR